MHGAGLCRSSPGLPGKQEPRKRRHRPRAGPGRPPGPGRAVRGAEGGNGGGRRRHLAAPPGVSRRPACLSAAGRINLGSCRQLSGAGLVEGGLEQVMVVKNWV